MRSGRRRTLAGLALASLLALAACDPTSGYADAANAALPGQKRYFDGAGSRLVEGPWSRVVVDLDVDTLYHVGARRIDDDDPTFHLFGVDAQDGCQVSPNAGTWLMGKPEGAPYRLLPYIENIDDQGRGRLRFTTLDCHVEDIAIEGAGRPYPRLYDHGYLVPTKQGYTFVDPWAGESYEVAANLQSILVWNNAVLLWADDELKSFTDQFEPVSELGQGVIAALQIKNAFLIESDAGLERVDMDLDSLELEAEPVLPDACHIQHSSIVSSDEAGSWVVMELPCGSATPSVVHLDADTFEVLEQYEVPFELDARFARAQVPGSSDGEDPMPFSLFYLTELDEADLGTLWAWQAGSEEPLRLGERAELDAAFLESYESGWNGVAQVNYQVLGDFVAHDWLRFRWDGTLEVMAEHVIRSSSSGELLVNFDGVAADLPVWADTGVRIVAKDVPPGSGEASSFTSPRRYARIVEFDGNAGQLLLGKESQDAELGDLLAQQVAPESLRFSWFMPALMFLEDWDAEARTGSLVAYNYELEAKSTIATGVSSFDLTSYPWDGVIYSVPYGSKRGVYFSKAK